MGSKSLTILQLFFDTKFYEQNFSLWPNARKKSWSAHVELCVVQFSDCYVEPGQRYSMISETLPNWGGLKVENFGGKFKFQNLSSWNTLFSTLGGDEITFSGFIWGQELITKCPCWVKLHITEDNFCHFFKPPQFRFFLSKNVKLFEAIRSPLRAVFFTRDTYGTNFEWQNGNFKVGNIWRQGDTLYWMPKPYSQSDMPHTYGV